MIRFSKKGWVAKDLVIIDQDMVAFCSTKKTFSKGKFRLLGGLRWLRHQREVCSMCGVLSEHIDKTHPSLGFYEFVLAELIVEQTLSEPVSTSALYLLAYFR